MTTPKKAVAGRASSHRHAAPIGAVDAVQLLKDDHREVKRMFKDYDRLVQGEADPAAKQALAEKICMSLKAHTAIEEEIFYPAVREALEDDDMMDEAEVEHDSAKELIVQIEGMSPQEDLYDAKVKVLGEYIDHHVQEEESEMFPRVREADLDLQSMGDQMESRKDQLMREMTQEAAAHH